MPSISIKIINKLMWRLVLWINWRMCADHYKKTKQFTKTKSIDNLLTVVLFNNPSQLLDRKITQNKYYLLSISR